MSFAIGLLSGSSMDGIDGSLMKTDGVTPGIVFANFTLSYPIILSILLRTIEQALIKSHGDIISLGSLFLSLSSNDLQIAKAYLSLHHANGITAHDVVRHLTMLHAQVVNQLLINANVKSSDIAVIGFHGQNLYHQPIYGRTIQVGDAQLLANFCGITVIHDFRSHDVQNGGQGAPLAPIYHQALVVSQDQIYPTAVINCGGIANITMITGPEEKDIWGFDAGPGNVLIDRWVRFSTNYCDIMDRDGCYGRQGQVQEELLKQWRFEVFTPNFQNFLDLPPPKSLDSHCFVFPTQLLALSIEDGCATLEAFTAQCIVEALGLPNQPIMPRRLVLAGGGWNNPMIFDQLKERLQRCLGSIAPLVVTANDLGWSSQYMEAELMAYLAMRRLCNLPVSFPQTTGVSRPCIGGTITHPI